MIPFGDFILRPIIFCVHTVIFVPLKPPSGREGDHEVVEGVCEGIRSVKFTVYALSLSRLRRQLSLRFGHATALTATGSHSLPCRRFATSQREPYQNSTCQGTQ